MDDSKSINEERENDPDALWQAIDALRAEVHRLKKYETFYDMLRLANTPVPSETEGERT